MAAYLVRVALADRPGALGAVASRIGSVRGDVVGVEILERVGGRAVDEFVVELPDTEVVTLLRAEIEEVDGAVVEAMVPLADSGRDRRLVAYECASALLAERTPDGVVEALPAAARSELDAAWAAVVDVEHGTLAAAEGRAPAGAWLAAHVSGAVAGAHEAVTDVISVHLRAWDLHVVAGRPGWRFGARERARLEALARLADGRWADLVGRDAREPHPSHVGS